MIKPQLLEFMRRMDPNSVAIIPAARESVRSHDKLRLLLFDGL